MTMKNNEDEKIIKTLTKSNLKLLLKKLEAIKAGIYKTSNSEELKNLIKEVFTQDENRNFVNFCGQNKYSIDLPKDIEKACAHYEEELRNLVPFTLTLAYYPSVNSIERIADYIEEVAGKPVLLEIITKPEIVGGAIIEFNGRFHRNTLDDIVDKTL
jgi:F0F1-type ATP synthase delta subunit